MKMIKVSELFDVYYGTSLELTYLTQDKNGINFVSRTSKNNGVSARVQILPDVEPIPAGTISVAVSGSVMESFLQLEPYYTAFHVLYLVSKVPLTNAEKLYYCTCLRSNKFRYSYGRQANSTLKDLLIPAPEDIPQFVKDFSLKEYGKKLLSSFSIEVQPRPANYKEGNLVLLGSLFKVVNGIASSSVNRYAKKIDNNYIPFVRPSYRQETSISGYVKKDEVDPKFIFPQGTLYVSTNGQGSHTYSYVSTFEFVPNSDVSVLIPNRKMSIQEKLYYSHCITKNRFKFSYGRKPKGDRLKSILLPEYPPKEIFDLNPASVTEAFEAVLNRFGH